MPTANQIALTNAVAASHAAAIRWMDGPDRDPMIAHILAYWPPTDRYWPCHGHNGRRASHMDGGHWELVDTRYPARKSCRIGYTGETMGSRLRRTRHTLV